MNQPAIPPADAAPIRLRIEGVTTFDGALVIEIRRADATVTLRADGGEERVLRGAAAVRVAQKVKELAVTCALVHADAIR